VLTFVLGGIRSGKSAFALDVARRSGRVTYLATGTASDPEMGERIDAHRRSRPAGWTLVEEPLTIGTAVAAGSGTVLLESVDGWLANRMEAAGGAGANLTGAAGVALVAGCWNELLSLRERAGHLVAVSSEVGLSLVPLNAYGRAFTDHLGTLNQRLAASADEAYLVVAGIPVPLHPHRRDG